MSIIDKIKYISKIFPEYSKQNFCFQINLGSIGASNNRYISTECGSIKEIIEDNDKECKICAYLCLILDKRYKNKKNEIEELKKQIKR